MIADKKRKILFHGIRENSLVIMEGKNEILRNGDVFYLFRQDSDFLLLTGLDTPDLKLIGIKKSPQMEWILYSDEITEKEQIWGTSRLTHGELRTLSGIADIREMRYFTEDKKIFTNEAEHIYLKGDVSQRGFTQYREKIEPLEALLHELRMVKLPEEIEKIREAIRVTKLAHDHIRTIIKPGMYEYEIEAEIARVFRSYHATEAYPTIVARGVNACTLHYTRHDRRLEEGELVLIDLGAEYEGYASDITRVFSVGEISSRNKEIYDSVLAVKGFAEGEIRPGVKKPDYEKKVRERMDEELVKLGLGDDGKVNEVISRRYYPHSTSHFLGLDVHDIGDRDEVFAPGMVITCEPGIYIREEGIGIRIEDDILITEHGCENLSHEISL